MNKRHLYIVAGIILLTAAGAGAWFVAGRHIPPPQTGWDLQPRDPLVQVEFANMDRWDRALQNLEGISRLGGSDLDTPVRTPRSRRIRGFFSSILPGVPEVLSSEIGGSGYLSVTRIGNRADGLKILGAVEWNPPASAASSTGSGTVAFLEQTLLHRTGHGRNRWSKQQYGVLTLFKRAQQSAGGETIPALTMTSVGSSLVVGMGEGAVESAIDRYEDGPEMKRGPSLEGSREPRVEFSVSESFWERMMEIAKIKAPGWKNWIQDSMAGAYGTVRGRAGFENGHFRAESEMSYKPQNMHKTLRMLMEAPAAELRVPSFLPESTIWIMAQRLPGKPSLYDTFVNNVIGAMARHSSDPRRAMLARVIQSFLPSKQIKGLLETLGVEGGVGIYVDLDRLHSEEEPAEEAVSSHPTKNTPLNVLMIHSIHNRAAFKNHLETLLNQGIVSSYVHYDRQRSAIRFTGTDSIPARSIPLGFHNSYVLIGSDRTVINHAIERIQNGDGLPGASHFKTVRRKLPRKLNSLTYLGLAPLAPLLRSKHWERWHTSSGRASKTFRLDRNTRLEMAKRLQGVPGSVAAHWTDPEQRRVHSRVLSFGYLPMLILGAYSSLGRSLPERTGSGLFTIRPFETSGDGWYVKEARASVN